MADETTQPSTLPQHIFRGALHRPAQNPGGGRQCPNRCRCCASATRPWPPRRPAASPPRPAAAAAPRRPPASGGTFGSAVRCREEGREGAVGRGSSSSSSRQRLIHSMSQLIDFHSIPPPQRPPPLPAPALPGWNARYGCWAWREAAGGLVAAECGAGAVACWRCYAIWTLSARLLGRLESGFCGCRQPWRGFGCSSANFFKLVCGGRRFYVMLVLVTNLLPT